MSRGRSAISRRSALIPAIAGGQALTRRTSSSRCRPSWVRWTGTASGQPGEGTVTREYERVLRGRFVRIANRNSYPPQAGNRAGEEHEDVGYISFDRGRQRYVLRQFHVEGFVNEYVGDAPSGETRARVFTSEPIENIGPGWRTRETYTFHGPDELEEVFELAAPGKKFEVYSRTPPKRER